MFLNLMEHQPPSKEITASSVDLEVTSSLELIFPTETGDRIKRCIALYKTQHFADMSGQYNPVVMTQWCVERFLDNAPELDENNDNVAEVYRHDDVISDVEGDISITSFEDFKDGMVKGFTSGDELITNVSTTKSPKSTMGPPTSDKILTLAKKSDSNCISISDIEEETELHVLDKLESELDELTNGFEENFQSLSDAISKFVNESESQPNKLPGDIKNELQAQPNKLPSDIKNGLVSQQNELTDVNINQILPVSSSDNTSSDPVYTKSLSTSFDVSRHDMYSSTILDSSSEDSCSSIVSTDTISEEELPTIPFPKKANTSISSLFSKPQKRSSSSTSISKSSRSAQLYNSFLSDLKHSPSSSSSGYEYLNSKSTVTRPPGSAPSSPAHRPIVLAPSSLGTALSSLGTASNSLGTASNSLGTAPSSLRTASNSLGLAPSSLGLAPSSLGTASNSLGTASNSLGTALSSLGTASNSLGTASNSLGTASNSLGTAPSSLGTASNSLGTAPSSLGLAPSSLGTASNSLGTANSSLGTAPSYLGTATSSLGTASSSLGTANGSLGTANSSLGTSNGSLGTAPSYLGTANSSLGTAPSYLGTANGSFGTAPSYLGSANGSLCTASSSLGTAYSSLGTANSSLGTANGSLSSAYRSPSSAYSSNGSGNISPGSAHLFPGSAHRSPSSAHSSSSPQSSSGSTHKPAAAFSSNFKLSPSKFNYTQKSPGKAVPHSTLQPNVVTSKYILTTTPEFSSMTTSPVITHSSLSSQMSPTRDEQTITIQSTHHITCSSSKKSPTSEGSIPVVTEITAPGPQISVSLKRIDAETVSDYKPVGLKVYKAKNDIDKRLNNGCQIKCGFCAKCKDDNNIKEPKLHLDNNEKTVSNNNNKFTDTMPQNMNAADQHINDIHGNHTTAHGTGIMNTGKPSNSGFIEGQLYLVSHQFNKGQKIAMLYTNGELIPYYNGRANEHNLHQFIEGITYRISCEGHKCREMVWVKGKLRCRREMLQSYHAERRRKQEWFTKGMLAEHRKEQEDKHKRIMDRLELSRRMFAAGVPKPKVGNFDNWREQMKSLYTDEDKEEDLNLLNPTKNVTEKSSAGNTNHVPLVAGNVVNLLDDNEAMVGDVGKVRDDDHSHIFSEDDNDYIINDIQPIEIDDDNESERIKKEVLKLIPDVDSNYLDDLISTTSGPMAVNNICFHLLETKYPKSGSSAATETTSTVKKVGEKKQFMDYYSSPPEYINTLQPKYERYKAFVFNLLSDEFIWISLSDIRYVLNHRLYYAPAHRELSEIWKIPTDAVKNAKSSAKDVLKGFTFDYTITTKTGEKNNKKIKLLKNRRPDAAESFIRHFIPEAKDEVDFVEQMKLESAMEEDYKIAYEMNEQEYETEGQFIECGCCYMECPFEFMVQCCEGHLFCETCLKQYAREAIFGQGKADLKCMTDLCGSSFPHSQIEKALPSDVLLKYEDRCREESLNLADLGDLVKCPFCEFRACLDADSRVFMCQNPDCKKESCRHCQSDWDEHFGKKCSEIEKKDETKLRVEYEEKMTKAKVRVCHRCKAQFTKEDGCNKMTCRCGAKQCYICRKPDIDYNHFCGHPRDPGKNCTVCTRCSLWTNPDEDDNRAISELQKKAIEEKKLKGYTSETLIGVPDQPPLKKQKKK